MTPQDRRAIVKVGIRIVAFCAWVVFVLQVAIHYLWPARIADIIGKDKVKLWISQSGVHPTVGMTITLAVSLGLTCLLVWLPVWWFKKRISHEAKG